MNKTNDYPHEGGPGSGKVRGYKPDKQNIIRSMVIQKKKKQDERQNMTERVTFEPRPEVRKEAM